MIGAKVRLWVTTILAIGTLACGDGSGPDGLGAEFVSGIWDITVEGCLNGVLPVRLEAEEDGALTSAQNAWTNNEDLGFFRPLDGEVDLETGEAEFHMWADGDREAALLFVGTLDEDGGLTGTVRDPMPGYGPIFHFSGGPACEVSATGAKR